MRKIFIAIVAIIVFAAVAQAQTLKLDGLQILLPSGNSITITLKGSISHLDVGVEGSITYDAFDRMTKIGASPITYDALDRMTKIGASPITYDALDRMTKIGASSITYDAFDRITKIGASSITYDAFDRINRVQSQLPEGLRLSFRMVKE